MRPTHPIKVAIATLTMAGIVSITAENLRAQDTSGDIAAPASPAVETPAPAPTPLVQKSSDTSNATTNEEVTVLPEFTVSTKKTNDYMPAETTTGTRVATKIQDLPFSVGVVTSEFLDDFAATEFLDQMAYTGGVTVYETPGGGGSNIRGIDASVSLRNGFRRSGMIDSVTTDHIEVIKGANAGIYGPVYPGGIVNTVTKQPKTKAENKLKFVVGNNNFYRGEASSTGPLGTSGKLFYLITLAGQTQDFDVKYAHMTSDVVSGNLLWKITPRTSLSLELEYTQRHDRGTYQGATLASSRQEKPDPYYPQVSTDTPRNTAQPRRMYFYYTGIATNLYNVNTQGPASTQNRFVKTATITFEHRFNSVFSLRSSGNAYKRYTERQEFGIMDYDKASDSITRGQTPDFRPIFDGGAAFQTDLLASWKTGPVKHKTLLTFDYQRITNTQMQYNSYYNSSLDTTTRGTAANPTARGSIVVPVTLPNGTTTYISTSDYQFMAYPSSLELWNMSTSPNKGATYGDSGGLPIYTYGTTVAPVPVGTRITLPSGQVMVVRSNANLGVPVNQLDYRVFKYKDHPEYYYTAINSQTANDIFGMFLSERATMWQDRINIFGGVRIDSQRSHVNDRLNKSNQTVWTSNPSFQFGATAALMPGLNAFINACRSFIPNFTPGTVDINHNPFVPPNQVGKSWEVGFKINAFKDKFNATISHYDIVLNNVSQDAYDNAGFLYTAVAGKQYSRGDEIGVSWLLTNALQLTANYAYDETKTAGNTVCPAWDGNPTRRAPRNTVGITLKYTFRSGGLKGLSLTTGFLYKDRMMPTAPGGRTITTSSGEIQNVRMPNGQLVFNQIAALKNVPEGAILPYQAKVPGTNQYYSLRVDDGRNSLYDPPYALWQAGVNYQFKPSRRYQCGIQFNMLNILNREYVVGNYKAGDLRGWKLTYTLKF